MASYTLNRSRTTGWWHWQCKDGSNEGWSPSKRRARNNAEESCGIAFILTPPIVEAKFLRGFLSEFSVDNLDDKKQTFSVGEINEGLFLFYFGLECVNEYKLTDEEKIVTILKIWGIYRGGLNKERIMKLHNLNKEQFNLLAKKDYWGLKIKIDENGKIHWNFPK